MILEETKIEEFISGRVQSNSAELLLKKMPKGRHKFELEAEEIYYKKKKFKKVFKGNQKRSLARNELRRQSKLKLKTTQQFLFFC